MTKFETYQKVCRTIDTCTTPQQLKGAMIFAERFMIMFCDHPSNWMCNSIQMKLVDKNRTLNTLCYEEEKA
jgi:hypothetical protein